MNSRWSNKPEQRRSIRPDNLGDIEILKALGRHGILTTNDIAAVVGRTYDPTRRRLTLLKYEGLITVHATQLQQPHLWQCAPQAFHLTPKGEAKLRELGFEPKPRGNGHFIHTLTQGQTSASFEIGARLAGLEYCSLNGKPIEVNGHKLIPDGGPLELGRNDYWRYVVFETDCATEPLTSSNKDRQAIERKFAAYLAVLGQGLYETYWKIPNITVLFTTTTKARLDSMRDLLASMTADYRQCFRFHLFPTILSGAARQPTGGWAVTETGLAPKEK
jgi:hypothetical protein